MLPDAADGMHCGMGGSSGGLGYGKGGSSGGGGWQGVEGTGGGCMSDFDKGAQGGGGKQDAGKESKKLDSKLDTVASEYGRTVMSELERQRGLHEAQLSKFREELSSQADACRNRITHLTREISETTTAAAVAEKGVKTLDGQLKAVNERLSLTIRENASLKKDNDEMSQALKKLQDGVHEAAGKAAGAIDEKQQRVAELQEQIRDLKFFMEAQAKLARRSDSKELATDSSWIETEVQPTSRRRKKQNPTK
jgi:BRCA1-associated protein